MNDLLENSFNTQIKALTGLSFQKFITKLFMYKYGANNYIPLRKTNDQGADGIINNDTIVACYGPEKIEKNRCLKKMSDDYKAYQKNWQSEYKNWMFVVNQELPPYAAKKINDISKAMKVGKSEIVGLTQILFFINALKKSQQQELGEHLYIDKSFFGDDYLKRILEDLIHEKSNTDENVKYEKPVYLKDKARLNFDKKDIDTINKEYEMHCESGLFGKIKDLLAGYKDEDIQKLKTRIIYDYTRQVGNFSVRLPHLVDRYQNKYANEEDDNYLYYIKALLLYFFEQCLIGRRAEKK